jgi:TPR repeat protein
MLALCAALAAAPLLAAPPPWLEIKSPHFTVVTNDSERQARKVAWQFEQIRAAVQKIWPWAKIDTGRPFVVFAARDEATLKTLAPQYWEGKRFRPTSFSAAGRDREFVALRTDVAEPDEIGSNPYQTAYWSYVSAVFSRSFPQRLPHWYSRGMAEVLSNTIVREREVHVGRPMRGNLELMTQRPLIPFEEFLAADQRSHWLTQDGDISRFDAQAWALMHLLMFGDKGAYSELLNRYGGLLMKGVAHDAALKEAFGDMNPYSEKMRLYVTRALFSYAKVPLSTETRREAYTVGPLSAAEAASLRGQLLVAMRRPVEARAAAAEAAKADRAHPGPAEIEAELLDAEGKRSEAKEAYALAVEAGSRRAHIHYRLAQLEWTPNAERALTERLAGTLEKARELEPESANTLSFLADVRIGLGQNEEALRLATKAVEIEPAESYHRVTLARAYWSLRRVQEAQQAAQSALQTADNDAERRQAQEFLDFLSRAGSRPNTPAAAVATAQRAAAAPPTEYSAVANCFGNRDDRACALAAPVLEAECGKGAGEACRSLGSLYDGGFGVPQDKARAAAAYARGCSAGHQGSCARLAVLQVHGEGVNRDAPQGLATLERLCGQGVDDGCIGWAVVLINTRGKPEAAKARELLQPACERGNSEACRLMKGIR